MREFSGDLPTESLATFPGLVKSGTMEPESPVPNLLLACLAGLWLCSPVRAVVTVVDSFDQGPFNLTLQNYSESNNVNLPLGLERYSTIGARRAALGTILSSSLDTTTGQVSFLVSGPSSFPNPWSFLDLRMSYSQGGPHSIAGYAGFVFDFSQMIGAGALIVELGSGSAIYGATTHRLPLTGAGETFYSFDDLNFGPGGSVDSFHVIHFIFEAHSEQFSFTLDEIRLVPEPSVALLGLSGCALFLRRSRQAK
jgi:hypothetical protein